MKEVILVMGRTIDGVYYETKAKANKRRKEELLKQFMSGGICKPAVYKGYPTRLLARDDGKLFNIDSCQEVVGTLNAHGYLKIEARLITPDGIKTIKTGKHRMIAETFIPNPDGKSEVNHKDLNHTNNAVSNLEWVNPKENTQHFVNSCGREYDSYCSNITVDKLPYIFRLIIANGYAVEDALMKEFNCAKHVIPMLREVALKLDADNAINMNGEVNLQWRQCIVNGSDNNPYMVSPYGLIRNGNNIVSGTLNNEGYIKMNIRYNGGKITKTTPSKLVAETFIPNPDKKDFVIRSDGNKLHNWVDNLMWATPAESAQLRSSRYDHGLQGESNGRSIYTEEQIKRACEMMCKPLQPNIIERDTGVKCVDQYKIRIGVNWNHVSSKYNFPNGRWNTSGTKFTYADGKVLEFEDTRDRTLMVSQIPRETAVQICEMLMQPDKYTMKEISDITGAPYTSISKIKSGDIWGSVSKQYNFPYVVGNQHSRKIFWS